MRALTTPEPPVWVDYLAAHPDVLSRPAAWLHAEWFADTGLPPARALTELSRRGRQEGLPVALLAFAGGIPVGMASLVEESLAEAGGTETFLTGVYVIPPRRGQGVGTLLCRRALTEARRLGLPRLLLYTPDRVDFYARLGWVSLEETILPIGDHYRIVTLIAHVLT